MVLSLKSALIPTKTITKVHIGYLISDLLAKGQVCPTSSGHIRPDPWQRHNVKELAITSSFCWRNSVVASYLIIHRWWKEVLFGGGGKVL